MSQNIKVQNGVITYSNADPALALDFTIGGNLNIDTINGAAYPPPSSGTPGGSTMQLQYNNSGVFSGVPGMSWDATRNLLVFAAPNETIYDLGNLGSSLNQDLDLTVANNFCCTIGGNITFNLVGAQYYQPPPTRSMISSITLYLQQDSAGSRIPAWPTGMYWPGGTIPAASITPGAIDIYTFLTYNGGTSWMALQQAKGLVSVI